MKDIVAQMPLHCQEGWDLGRKVNLDLSPPFNSILILGMGGSAIGGDVASALLKTRARIPLVVNRNYDIPDWVDNRTLVVASSYSGNTEEILTAFKKAKSLACPLLGISAGGRLAQEFERNENFVLLPGGLPPRSTIGYVLCSLLAVLERLEIAEFPLAERQECLQVLNEIQRENSIEGSSRAFFLATALKDKLPVIYGTAGLGAVAAARWKCQFNENSKVMAFAQEYPELNHNEIVGWEDMAGLRRFVEVIHLIEADGLERLEKRMAISKDILQKNGIRVHEVKSSGNYPLSKTMSLIMQGDYVTCYLADLYGVDPIPVNMIEYLKERLAASED